jgi:1,4-alpha-glucan branching enzyme
VLCQNEFNGYNWNDFENAIRVIDPGHEGYKRPHAMINYVESHDEERTVLQVMKAGFDRAAALRKSALGATVLFAAAGQPMIFQGQEWGEATERRMDHNFIQWEKLNGEGGKELHEHYKRMCWLRRGHPALRSTNIAVDAVWPQQKCVAYRRWDDQGDVVIVAADFDSGPQRVALPPPAVGRWKEWFSDKIVDIQNDGQVELDRWSALVYLKP